MHEANRIQVAGHPVDNQTRCVHYHSAQDVVAIKFACCGTYYPCFRCHAESAGHQGSVWPASEWNDLALLCGVCRHEMTINAYLGASSCPACGAQFNPGCSAHHHLYFETPPAASVGHHFGAARVP